MKYVRCERSFLSGYIICLHFILSSKPIKVGGKSINYDRMMLSKFTGKKNYRVSDPKYLAGIAASFLVG